MRAPPTVEENSSNSVQRNLRQIDYSEYEWMENQELFDRQIMAQLDEEAFYEECLSEVMEAEQLQQQWNEDHNIIDCASPNFIDDYSSQLTVEQLSSLVIISVEDESRERSKLNPDAPEFFPSNSFLEATSHQHSENQNQPPSQ